MSDHPSATVYANGRILTMERGVETHEALGVRDGRVVARGDAADVRRAVGRGAQEVDLRGGTVMPGIVDTHPHVVHFGLIEGPLVDLKDATSHAVIVARIAARARTTPKGEWIMCSPIGEPHYSSATRGATWAGGCRIARPRPRDDGPSRLDTGLGAGHPERHAQLGRAGAARAQARDARPGGARVDREGRVRGPDRDPPRLGHQLLHRRPLHELTALSDALSMDTAVGHGARAAGYAAMGVTTAYEGHVMDAA
jgi:hypothetical protein